jgi:hypothetical protein
VQQLRTAQHRRQRSDGATQVYLRLLLGLAAARRPSTDAQPQAPLGPDALLAVPIEAVDRPAVSLPSWETPPERARSQILAAPTPLTASGSCGTDSKQ